MWYPVSIVLDWKLSSSNPGAIRQQAIRSHSLQEWLYQHGKTDDVVCTDWLDDKDRSTMTTSVIVELDASTEIDEEAIGPKAGSLARMAKLGLPVPSGFCLTALCYQQHIQDNGLSSLIDTTVETLNEYPAAEKDALLGAIRQAIANAPMAAKIRNMVEEHYRRLGSEHVAVRSSSTAEDLPGHSFAGQYDTYFVADLGACLDRIKNCWASLWTWRAFDYRQRNGFDHTKVSMAVIVQELIDSEVSGVLFTADPLTLQDDRLIIESCFGLGEALVSGKVAPDRMVLNKKDLSVTEQQTASKRLAVVMDQEGGVVEQTVADERSDSPSLEPAAGRRLAAPALEAARTWGVPLDLEWALSKGRFYFIQARPITTCSLKEKNMTIWSNVNTAEVLPDVVTPMTWSIISGLVDDLLYSLFGSLGIEFDGRKLTALIAGRAYFNATLLGSAFKSMPFFKNVELTDIFGGMQGDAQVVDELSHMETESIDFSYLQMMTRLPRFAKWFLQHSPGRGQRFVIQLDSQTAEAHRFLASSPSEQDLSRYLRVMIKKMNCLCDAIAFAGVGMMQYSNLSWICRRWFPEQDGSLANRLLCGGGDVQSAEAGLALWDLSITARKSFTVKSVITSAESWKDARERLEGWMEKGSPEAGEFLDEWDAFMRTHGHHARGEIELYNPRWVEKPDYVMDLLRKYLEAADVYDRRAQYQAQAAAAAELAEDCPHRLHNPLKKVVFSYLLTQAKAGARSRENTKSAGVGYFSALRLGLLTLGQHLADRGLIDRAEDIFFLEWPEVEQASSGEMVSEFRVKIAVRKTEHERNRQICAPPVIIGDFNPSKPIETVIDERVEILKGLSASSGVVTGPARVIASVEAEDQVLPGEILVAPFTDPGWTPYFIPAAGIVMDQGGLLSHGSIIAREYGIPAVVNVGPATKLIKTGQLIRVDGNTGTVTILS